MKRTALTTLTLLTATAGTFVLATGTGAADSEDRGSGAAVARFRKDIAKYADVGVALAEGFFAAGPCTTSPAGGMGVHYVNPGRMDRTLVAAQPEALLYEPTADGGLALVGAEYVFVDADGDLGTVEQVAVSGQALDGPMPGHDPQMPVHYDLHVWTHEANPAGTFAPWNRRVTC